jgi:hypothetical protein
MSNAFLIIKMCYVYSQWYDILCATLCVCASFHFCVVGGKGSVTPALDVSPCHDDTPAIDDEWFWSHSNHVILRTDLVPTGWEAAWVSDLIWMLWKTPLALAWNITPVPWSSNCNMVTITVGLNWITAMPVTDTCRLFVGVPDLTCKAKTWVTEKVST